MADELTTSERNALKWVLFQDFYQDLTGTYLDAQERYFKVDGFLKSIGINDDRGEGVRYD